MDCCLSYPKPNLPSFPAGSPRRPTDFRRRFDRNPGIVVAARTSGTNRSQFGGLSAPLQPSTPTGKFLSGVLLDDRDGFQSAAREELERLSAEKDDAAARLKLSLGSDEACLHRRIAESKKHETQDEVQDVMYMLVLHKFSKMNVHLVPKLSKCVFNGRLEIWPSKDWELESIHGSEALQMVREHLKVVVGCCPNANITDTWATTEVQRVLLCQLYTASISYGYFLKTATLRQFLEQVLDMGNSYLGFGPWSRISEVFSEESRQTEHGHSGTAGFSSRGRLFCGVGEKWGNLRRYAMGFDREMIEMCARPKFKETVNVIERHSCALFGGDEEMGVIKTSFASLKRFLLEAVAFGSFLWEVEDCVNDVYMLEEN